MPDFATTEAGKARRTDREFDSIKQQLSSIMSGSASGMTIVEAMIIGQKAHTALGILDGRLDVESSKIVLTSEGNDQRR